MCLFVNTIVGGGKECVFVCEYNCWRRQRVCVCVFRNNLRLVRGLISCVSKIELALYIIHNLIPILTCRDVYCNSKYDIGL